MEERNIFLKRLETLHTTMLGEIRISKNCSLKEENVVEWCKEKCKKKDACIYRKGKNWYIETECYRICVNAHSNTIITAHRIKK